MPKQLLATLIFVLWVGVICPALADQKNHSTGFVDFNTYGYLSDVESDNSLTVNILARLDDRWQYFSLSNFRDQAGSGRLTELDTYYTEQNIRWKTSVTSPVDLTVQLNFRSGGDNDRHRLGFRWRLNNTRLMEDFLQSIHLKYSMNFHLVQFDHEDADVRQIEHVFSMKFPYLTDRLYLAGFVDHTFHQDLPEGFPDNPIVGEVQLGLRIFHEIDLIAEYRVNEYRRSDVNNLAIGLEYKLNW